MTRVLTGLLVTAATTATASTPVPSFLDGLTTFWDEVAAADAIIVGTVTSTTRRTAEVRVDERLKGEAPPTIEGFAESAFRPLPVGAQVLCVLFRAERFDADVLAQNPAAKEALAELRRTQPTLSTTRQLEFATGERTRVIGVVTDLLAAQREKRPRNEAMARRLFALETTRSLALAWLTKTGVTEEATRRALAQRVLSRSAGPFEAADVLSLLEADHDPALTDALLDILKKALAQPRIAKWLQGPFEALARRVDPSLTVPPPSGHPEAEAQLREWFAKVEARWQAVKAAP